MSADDFFSEGNEAFVDDDYSKAIQKYSLAIEQNSHNSKYYSQRANAFIKLEKYQDALADTSSALCLDTANAKAFLRKGIAHFHLKQFKDAKEAFESALNLEGSDETKSWISKCNAELQTVENSKTNSEIVQTDITTSEPPLPKAQLKPRYDWYQTDSRVVITILVKNRTSDDVKCDIQETQLSISVRLEDGGAFSLTLKLANVIIPAQSKHRVSTSKAFLDQARRPGHEDGTIVVVKAESIRWSSLERKDDVQFTKFPLSNENKKADAATSHSYPTSSHVHRNWDKLAADIEKEEKEEKLEGDAALNQLFQKIYGDGSDEVKRAMNKSFIESGGTVLSTNWSDVGSKKVEVKPPDGMEYKKYS